MQSKLCTRHSRHGEGGIGHAAMLLYMAAFTYGLTRSDNLMTQLK